MLNCPSRLIGFYKQAELVARDNAHASRFRAVQHETDSGAQVLKF
jgi:hypothetical protein